MRGRTNLDKASPSNVAGLHRAFVLLVVLSLPVVAFQSAASADTQLVLHLDDDERASIAPPAAEAPTLVRYDDNQYPFVAAQPMTWTFTPTTDLHLTGLGGSIWFRTDATHVERDLAPLLSTYELGLFQGDDPGLVTGAQMASVSGDSDNPVFPTFTPNGDYRVDFPRTDADAHFVADVPVEVRVLVWTTNGDHGWLANDGTFLHDMLDSDLAVLFGSQDRDSQLRLEFD